MPMMAKTTRLLSVLLVVSAAAFAIGVAIERSQHHESGTTETAAHRATETAAAGAGTSTGAESTPEAATTQTASSSEGTTAETGAQTETGAAGTTESTGEGGTAETQPSTSESSGSAPETTAAVSTPVEGGHHDSGETLLGISTESTGLVALAVLASLVLAGGLWLRGARRELLAAALLVGLVFAAFDVREALHQADLSQHGLLAIAIVVAGLHLAVVLVAARALATAGPAVIRAE